MTPRGSESVSTILKDAGSGCHELVVSKRDRHVRIAESGLEFAEQGRSTWRVVDGDPLSALAISEQRHMIGREGWKTRIDTRSTLSANESEFLVTNELDAYEGDDRVFSKVWRATIPRDGT